MALLLWLLFSSCFASDDQNLTLLLDEAAVRISNQASLKPDTYIINVYSRSHDCYECVPQFFASAESSQTTDYIVVNTYFPYDFELRSANDSYLSTLTLDVKQHGYYTLIFTGSSDQPKWNSIVDQDGENAFVPIYAYMAIFFGCPFLWYGLQLFYHRFRRAHAQFTMTVEDADPVSTADMSRQRLPEENAGPWEDNPTKSINVPDLPYRTYGPGTPEVSRNNAEYASPEKEIEKIQPLLRKENKKPKEKGVAKSERLKSLDTFRGLALTIMIFVNYGGGSYWFFNHSTWNGLTVADLVFPWFIWIMGTSMAMSFVALERQKKDQQFFWKVVRRSCILFALGLFINNGYDTSQWRIPGVLQRFGVSYFFVANIAWYVPHKKMQKPPGPYDDLLDHKWEWLIMAAITFVWLMITYTLDVPGCGRGYLGPGGIGDNGNYQNCTGGAAGYIDQQILGLAHMYLTPTCQTVYQTGAYDPEGILGCLTSIVMTYIGLQSGRIFVYYKEPKQRLIRFAIWAFVLGIIAIGLCGGKQNGGAMPINKNLWSLSFILAQSSTGFLTLGICYILVDIFKLWTGAPFIFIGMNSIAVYCGHETLAEYFPFSYHIGWPGMQDHWQILTSNLIGTGAWVLIAYYMHSIDFFVKV